MSEPMFCPRCQELLPDYCTCPKPPPSGNRESAEPGPARPKKSVATLLVEIANDLYTFGCVSEQRGHTSRIPGDDPVAVHTFAMPKSNPDVKRPLPEIRSDLAAVYQMTYGSVPGATAIGDAMMVLEVRRERPNPCAATTRCSRCWPATRPPPRLC
ncbi:MAG TPA: hypothetical protein VI011_17815 [Asanoa sp.]